MQTGPVVNGVLFGDAHVENLLGEPLAERQQPGGVGHGRRDGDQVVVFLGQLDQRFGEGGGAGVGLDRTDVMHVLDRVILRRRVAATLLGLHVQDHRAGELTGVLKRLLNLDDVVTVERAHVPNTELLEKRLRLQ